ncbi:MAG: polymerase, partial [Micromonosporaceae bacterium]|nr:polymerase [Micromonosporaceae bacterium]
MFVPIAGASADPTATELAALAIPERVQGPILHADLDSFFASVEQRDHPALRGRAVLVGGGVVLAASYEAKAYGVRSGMGGGQARRLCPHAVEVPPRFEAYAQASKDVFAVFHDTTPVVEGLSIDEAFLNVAGLRRVAGTPVHIAIELRRRVRDRVGLAITVGVARTKFLAKVASGLGKPDGLLVVRTDAETDFLYPLPVERLWGVGRVTAAKLRERGIRTVGEISAVPEASLVAMLGPASARHLFGLAQLRDPRPVRVGVRRRSIGSQRALGARARLSRGDADAALAGLVDRVTRRLRSGERLCRTVVLRLRYGDFTRATRSHTLPRPTADTGEILAALRSLLAAAWPEIERAGLTLIGVSLANLGDSEWLQLELPFGRGAELVPHSGGIDPVLDVIRGRYGA